ncbi:MAG TPA: hypothetical protein VK509_23955 [Polyangiales bacterium]|nr:hypothetical protein [Polyangiales bacterium]
MTRERKHARYGVVPGRYRRDVHRIERWRLPLARRLRGPLLRVSAAFACGVALLSLAAAIAAVCAWAGW